MNADAEAYRYLRVEMIDDLGGFPAIQEVEMWGFLTESAAVVTHPPSELTDMNDIFAEFAPTVTASTTNGGSPGNLVDRNTATEFYTNDAANQWVAFELAQAARPTAIAILGGRSDRGYVPKQFVIEGSVDGLAWDTLRTVNKNATSVFGHLWGFYWIETDQQYNHVRITQTGTNVSGSNYFLMREVLLFGDSPT